MNHSKYGKTAFMFLKVEVESDDLTGNVRRNVYSCISEIKKKFCYLLHWYNFEKK